jgi:hypothetical protein
MSDDAEQDLPRTEEEHRRRLTAFVSGLAHWFGIVEEERADEARTVMRRWLLQELERRGLALAEADRQRILAETDTARLERWHERAATAATLAEIFAGE